MAREKKFTPGPWEAVSESLLVMRGHDTLASVYTSGYVSSEEASANVNLMSASRELLRACERFVDGVEAHADDQLKGRLSGHLSFMREAIAKAYGESK